MLLTPYKENVSYSYMGKSEETNFFEINKRISPCQGGFPFRCRHQKNLYDDTRKAINVFLLII